MSYIGNSLTQQSFTGGVDQFNGNASNTAFGLTRTINTNFDVDVYVENVWQRPGVGYNVSANTITFTSAPSAGSNNVVVVYKNFTATSVVPISGSVTTTTLVDGAVTPAKLSTGAPSWDSSSNHVIAGNQTIGGNLVAGNNAANKLSVNGNVTGQPAYLTATGTDANVGVDINTKGTGSVRLNVNSSTVLQADSSLITLPFGQLKFPVTQNASSDANTLDDYEEGTWTPVVTPSTGTITSQTCSGNYIKVGRLVTITFNAQMLTGTMTAVAQITGLPFVISTGTPVGISREWYASGNAWEIIGNNGAATCSLIRYDNSSVCNAQFAWNGTFTYITSN